MLGVKHGFRAGFFQKRVMVLDGLNFSVTRGSVFGLLGSNGAGKTTLIHLVVGLTKPVAGRITINDVCSLDRAAKSMLGYLPERPYFPDHLTGEGLLKYFGRLSGLTDDLIRKRIPETLEEVGLAKAGEVQLKKYSKGMLQRIGIAQAIIHDPELLVLDEPMSGLDPLGRKEMRELIIRLAARGKTVFFSSHVIHDVEMICDSVALLRNGKVARIGTIGELLSKGPLQTEIAFTGVVMDQVSCLYGLTSLQSIPDGLRGIVSGNDAVKDVIQALIKLNARILWVTPVRPSLEDLFIGETS
ncbi:MAG: ABC transporter ATP-binding protein [Bdellovibrionota bacterium]